MSFVETVSELWARTNISLVILTMGLLLARLLPVIVLSPFIGGEVVPMEVKMGTAVVLGVVLYPVVADRLGQIPLNWIPYIALLLKEVFVGMALAFVVSMVFEAAQVAGTLADTMAGANNAQLYAPQIGQQVSLFANLKVQLSIVAFLMLNGHHVVIESLADSFLTVPLSGFPAFSHGVWGFFELLMRVFGDILLIAMGIAAPALVATFLADLALGMVNRVAPQIQVFFMSMSIKPLMAIGLIFFAIHLLVDRLEVEFGHMLEVLREAIRLLA